MNQTEINNKLRSAKELGLDVSEEYKNIDGNNFIVLNIKKGETIIESILSPLDVGQAKKQLQAQKESLTNAIAKLEEQIVQLNKLK